MNGLRNVGGGGGCGVDPAGGSMGSPLLLGNTVDPSVMPGNGVDLPGDVPC